MLCPFCKEKDTSVKHQEEIEINNNTNASSELNLKVDSILTEKIEEKKEENFANKEQEIEKTPTPTKPKKEPINEKYGRLMIDEPLFDFGRVNEGAIIEHEFEIRNSGNAVLHITNIEVDCGCTVPEYNKDGIAPGATDKIKVTFDTTGKLAAQVRYITIYTDGKPLSKLVRMKGLVATD